MFFHCEQVGPSSPYSASASASASPSPSPSLSPAPAQLIRGMYAPFMADWVAAFPGAVLALRTEDLTAPASRRKVLRAAWAHMGLDPLADDALEDSKRFKRAEARVPDDYAKWTTRKARAGPRPRPQAHPSSLAPRLSPLAPSPKQLELARSPSPSSSPSPLQGPILDETRRILRELYAPMNTQLAALLAEDGTSCGGGGGGGERWRTACEGFLWAADVA